MNLIRRVWVLVDAGTRRRMIWSAVGSSVLAALDTIAVLLVFPLIQLLVASRASSTAVHLPLGIELGGDGSLHDAAVLAAIVAALFLVKSSLSIAFLRWNLGFVLAAETSLAGRLFAVHLVRAPAAASALDTPGVQRTLTESLRRVFQDGLAYALPALADRLVILLLVAAILVIAPVEAVVAAVVFGGAALGYRRVIHSRTSRAGSVVHAEARQALSLSGEALRASREIALWDVQGFFVDRYVASRRVMSRGQRTIAFNEQLPRSYLEICLVVCTASVAVTAFSLEATTEAVALVGTFAAIAFRVLPALNRALLASTRARTALPSLVQIEADLDGTETDPARPDERGAPAGPVARVEIRGLTVRLPGREEPILAGVDLDLERGSLTGILGASGAGKTTLVAALLGFLPASVGTITIDGAVPVLTAASWHGRAAYVPQEVVVLDAPLRENVALGIPPEEIDEARVLEALRLAHLATLVPTLEHGTATVLGESGSRLSGGQRQRLGIARAMYHDAEVLVLDEATTGLDYDTEQRILGTLHELQRTRIIVIVSHHRSVMDRCDRLVVLEDGRVAGVGAVSDLEPLLVREGLSASSVRS
jgi:ABC-type multidrug transport system fused ATPase/permease subunit